MTKYKISICFVQRGLPLQSLQMLPNLASSAPALRCICHYQCYLLSFVNFPLYDIIYVRSPPTFKRRFVQISDSWDLCLREESHPGRRLEKKCFEKFLDF